MIKLLIPWRKKDPETKDTKTSDTSLCNLDSGFEEKKFRKYIQDESLEFLPNFEVHILPREILGTRIELDPGIDHKKLCSLLCIDLEIGGNDLSWFKS